MRPPISVMEEGARQHPPEYRREIRELSQEEFPTLPKSYQELEHPRESPVDLRPNQQKVQEQIIQEIKEKEPGKS